MDNSYWLKQSNTEPLFPDLIWSRPESKQAAGKLLIIGGNAHGFSAPAEAYVIAGKSGIGSTRVVMPNALKKLTGALLENVEYTASTLSGSFSKLALDDLLANAAWSDGVLFAGDLGKNSETAITIEKFINKYSGQVTFTKDATDYCLTDAMAVMARPETLLIMTIAQVQKLFIATKQTTAISYDMNILNLTAALNIIGEKYPATIIVKHQGQLLVSGQGFVSSTRTDLDNEDAWRLQAGTKAAVWWLQNPTKSFEAITTSLLDA